MGDIEDIILIVGGLILLGGGLSLAVPNGKSDRGSTPDQEPPSIEPAPAPAWPRYKR